MTQHPDLCDRLASFMAAKLDLSPDDLPRPGPWSRSGLTIGALSLRLNALNLDQIDAIIDRQELTPKLFGELAVDLGFLTHDEVQRLLQLQQLHWAMEFGELLVLRGAIDLPRMIHLLGEFLAVES